MVQDKNLDLSAPLLEITHSIIDTILIFSLYLFKND